MKKILTYFLFSVFLTSNFNYVLSIEPDVFVQSTVNRASKILSDNLSKQEKINRLKLIAKETVFLKKIGSYSLGSYRKTLTKDQKVEYLFLFEKYFLKSFSSRLSEWTNPEIEVISKKIINKNYTMVNSALKGTNKRPEVKIDWRIYTKDPENPLIVDVVIEGLSLARTQREEFSSILNSNDGDIKAFISPSLELRIEENSSLCVLAKLNPSITTSTINGFSGSLV